MTRSAQCGQATPTSGSGWAALGDPDLVGYADLLLRHTARLLALFVHVIEGREPETRETRVSTSLSSTLSPDGVCLSLSESPYGVSQEGSGERRVSCQDHTSQTQSADY